MTDDEPGTESPEDLAGYRDALDEIDLTQSEELPLYSELEDPSACVQQLVDDICDWPSYSPKRYQWGFKQIARVRAELDALERQLRADRDKLQGDHPSRGNTQS